MNHTGVKNVVTESTRVENKRERRRGAAGRAAVLRRAPSDSDCSGETASLSADSGDRAPRPPAVPPRSGKTRSRRRGSEWEVLEGLKDGQRFEKRPDVFNGYLHKKRKWPLKGWHKRFFVIDGGILVYARSPTDVARGRLHGSVDVGLSVISAKARRRRIDIDADEFIYHLRAKTPDVFRTWLNVLKTHRLYRQHLLTFGARESVPKIHAPLDDLPPTDTSSRTSTQVSTISSSVEDYIPKYTNKNEPCDYNDKVNNDIQIKEHTAMKNSVYQNHNSLCSMHCVSRRQEKQDLKSVLPVKIQQNNISLGSTDIEKQVLSTDLDMYSKSNDHLLGVPETENIKHCEHNTFDERKSLFKYLQATQAYYFFTHNKLQNIPGVAMKRSKKSTNLVKYRNFFHEPILCRPVNGSILLNKGKGKPNKGVAINAIPEQESNEVQVALQDNESIKTTSEDPSPKDHDIIAQSVIISLFKNKIVDAEAKQYIKQVIGELYDAKVTSEAHPVRELFKSLLNYWIRNTSLGSVKRVLTQSQSIDRQSNRHFTEDKSLSSQRINWDSKETQFHGLSDILIQLQNKKHNTSNKRLTNVKQEKRQLLLKSKSSPRRDTESFEKERRIQELEKIIKDTVYTVDTSNNTTNTHSKAKDIKITKTLIDNIGKLSQKTIVPEISITTLSANDNSNSSTEKIQQTINHLISETAIPPDIAKEFLNAYLDVLIHDDNNLSNTSTQSSEQSRTLKVCSDCEVQTEDIMKKVTKSVTIIKTDCENPILDDDPGALYLKDILDKVTTIFSGVGKHWDTESQNEIQVGDGKENQNKSTIKEPPVKSIIYENVDDKSVVIDLTKYNLEHISMSNDPAVNGLTSIIIKLKESTRNTHTKQTRLKLKFSDSNRLKCVSNDNWLEYPINTETRELNKNIELRRNSYFPKEFDLRPYLSTSNVTSIPAQVQNKSEHSMCQSFNSSNALQKELYEEEHKSCYTLSFKSRILSPKCKTMKKITSKDSISKVLSTTIEPQDKPSISIFKKPVPRVIDEKFILLLLENLTLLAKNVPSLYTEINALYLKLSEKYQKISGSNIQRLNLLSRIYNGSDTTVKDAGIQLEKKSHSKIAPPNTQIGTNTSTVKFAEKTHVIHEILSAARFYVINNTSQTSREIKKKTDKETSSVNCQSVDMYADSFFVHVNNDDNNYRPLGTTNVWPQINHYKCVLNMNTTNNRLSEIKKQKRHEKFKEKSFLSPSSMVSIQSQTDKKRIRFARDRGLENNLKVYHLFKSNRFSDLLVNSISTSNIDSIFSDDMKTLYRCSSGPSFCSS